MLNSTIRSPERSPDIQELFEEKQKIITEEDFEDSGFTSSPASSTKKKMKGKYPSAKMCIHK